MHSPTIEELNTHIQFGSLQSLYSLFQLIYLSVSKEQGPPTAAVITVLLQISLIFVYIYEFMTVVIRHGDRFITITTAVTVVIMNLSRQK
jgi:hypothetical protein